VLLALATVGQTERISLTTSVEIHPPNPLARLPFTGSLNSSTTFFESEQMSKKSISLHALSAVALAALLTACGGGGGGDSSTGSSGGSGSGSSGSGGVVVTPTNPSTIVNSVADATYTASSEDSLAYEYLNQQRSTCGFGKLAQSTKLDTAAKAHADWSLINNYYGHNEASTIPLGYTGNTPKDRVAFAGYNVQEATETLIGSYGITSISGFGKSSASELMAMPYHLFGMMSPFKDVGVSIRSVNSVTPLVPNGLSRIAVFDFGVANGDDYQTVEASTVLTYPCEGVTGVATSVKGEVPNPVPGRDLATNPLGHSLLVMVRKDQTLAITSASLVNTATGNPVTLRPPVTAANDVNGVLGTFGNYMGFVMPDAPLATNTKYQATIAGTNNGTPFTRSFTFTTGN